MLGTTTSLQPILLSAHAWPLDTMLGLLAQRACRQLPVSEVGREQEYIGRLYERVDVLRGRASARIALALRQDGGTSPRRRAPSTLLPLERRTGSGAAAWFSVHL